jgi:hypothetical protein
LTARLHELNESINEGQTKQMNNKKLFLESVKKVAKGKKLSLTEKRATKSLSKNLKSVLESQQSAISFIQHYVKTHQQITESSEVEQAQLVLAAQDMVDRVQKMIEDISDLKVKELPALVNNIRAEMDSDTAIKFRDSVAQNLDSLLQNLTDSKNEFETTMGIITGEDLGGQMDDDMEMPEEPMDDIGADLGAEEEMEEPEMPMAEPNLGRAKR